MICLSPQVVHQSMHTGLLTHCVEFRTDRGVRWETALERRRLEARALNPAPCPRCAVT